MSSSEDVQPLELVDFAKGTPQRRRVEFAPTDFQPVRTVREPVPSPEEAHAQGLAEGEARGRAQTMKELAPVLARLGEITQSLCAARDERVAAAEQDLIDIATEITRRILHSELRQDSDTALRMAHVCLEEAKNSEGALVLRAAPPDVELLRAHIPELELDLAERQLQLLADPSITAGGVVLETAGRCYEGRPERVLQAALLSTRAGERT